MSDDRVVFLAFDNPNARPEADVYLLACSKCRNKTYKLRVGGSCAAEVVCAACDAKLGNMGWAPDDGESDEDQAGA